MNGVRLDYLEHFSLADLWRSLAQKSWNHCAGGATYPWIITGASNYDVPGFTGPHRIAFTRVAITACHYMAIRTKGDAMPLNFHVPRPQFVKESELLSKVWKGKKRSEEQPPPPSNAENSSLPSPSTLPPSSRLSIENDRVRVLREMEEREHVNVDTIGTDTPRNADDRKTVEPGGSKGKMKNVSATVAPQSKMNRELAELHKAVMDDDLPKIKELLKTDYIPLEKSVTDKETVLQLAVKMGRIDAVKELLQYWNASPNVQLDNGPTALHIAVQQNDLPMVELLLNRKDIDPYRISDDMTPRELAMSKASSEIQNALEQAEKSFHVSLPTDDMAEFKNLIVFRGRDTALPSPLASIQSPLYGRMPYIRCADGVIRRYPYGGLGEIEASSYRSGIERGSILDSPQKFIKEKIAFYDFDKDTMRGYFSVNGKPRKPVYSDQGWEIYQLDNGRYVIPQPTELTCSHAAEYMVLMAHGELTLDAIKNQGGLDAAQTLSGRWQDQVISHIRQKTDKELVHEGDLKIDADGGNEESIRKLATLINKNAPVALVRAGHYIVVDKIDDDLKSITYWDSYHGTYLTAELNNEFWGMWGRESPDKNNQFTVGIWGIRKD